MLAAGRLKSTATILFWPEAGVELGELGKEVSFLF